MSTTIDRRSTVPARFQPLHEKVIDSMERRHVPGVALGITVDGEDHTAGFGVTNVNYPSPVRDETLFQIGSTTKTVTATAVLSLVEAGKLDLDVPVRQYLPDLRLMDEKVARRVTLRHLLTHTAGWTGDHFRDTGRGDDALARIVASLADLEQVTPLGEVWSYNNAAFYLAGRVIEGVTEMPYEAAVRHLVLEPLGLTNSYFFPEEVMIRSFAVGHTTIDGRCVVATPWPIPRSANPAGGLASTAGDQLRYARFHMGHGMGHGAAGDGKPALSDATIAQMQTPIVAASEGLHMGWSWFLREVETVHIVQHGGSTNGQQALFEFAPEQRFALTILTNADAGAALIDEVERWVLQQYLGVSEPRPVHHARSEAELAEYAGTYDTALTSITVRVKGGMLELEYALTGEYPADTPPPLPPPTAAAFHAADNVIAVDGPLENMKGEFVRGPDGQVVWLRFSGRLHRRRT